MRKNPCKGNKSLNIVYWRHEGAQFCFGTIVIAIEVAANTGEIIKGQQSARESKRKMKQCFKQFLDVFYEKLEPLLGFIAQLCGNFYTRI